MRKITRANFFCCDKCLRSEFSSEFGASQDDEHGKIKYAEANRRRQEKFDRDVDGDRQDDENHSEPQEQSDQHDFFRLSRGRIRCRLQPRCRRQEIKKTQQRARQNCSAQLELSRRNQLQRQNCRDCQKYFPTFLERIQYLSHASTLRRHNHFPFTQKKFCHGEARCRIDKKIFCREESQDDHQKNPEQQRNHHGK